MIIQIHSHRHCTACFSCTSGEYFVNCPIRLEEISFFLYLKESLDHLEHGVNATGNTKEGHQLVEGEEVELGREK